MTVGTIVAIHIAPATRLPMKAVSRISAEVGAGLVGDRYHGTRHRHVSIQSLEALAVAAEELGSPIPPELTRRNVTVSGIEVPTAPGDRLMIGPVEVEVVRIAAPCRLLDDTIVEGARHALRRRAGAICRVLTSGTVAVGDACAVVESVA